MNEAELVARIMLYCVCSLYIGNGISSSDGIIDFGPPETFEL